MTAHVPDPLPSQLCCPWVDDNELPDGHVAVSRFFVAVNGRMRDGGYILCPLSPYVTTLAEAVAIYDRLAPDFPGCAIQKTLTAIDMNAPEQERELLDYIAQHYVEFRRLD